MSNLIINDHIQIPFDELHMSSSRSGGPGGQNVNKVNTKVTLHWNVADSTALPDDVRQRLYHRLDLGEFIGKENQ